MVLWAYLSISSYDTKGRRFETGRLLFFFFIANVLSANWREEIESGAQRRKAGAATIRFESGMVTRNVLFGSFHR